MRRLTILLLAAACGDDHQTLPPDAAPVIEPDASDPDALTAAELAQIATMSPLPAVPADTTNAYADNASAARLGQMLFYDKSYAGALAVADSGTNGGLGKVGDTGKVSCASCHAVGSDSLDDRRSLPGAVSLGTDLGTRNALGAINSSYYTWTNWGGRFDSQWSLPLAVAENAKIMNTTRLQVAHMLYAKYRTEYDAIFPVDLDPDLDPAATNASRFPATGKPSDSNWTGMQTADQGIVNRIYANYGKALAAYVRTLVSRDAPFDRFVAGDATAISPAAIRGVRVFLSAGCAQCHGGPTFTDNEFHALGVVSTDLGRHPDIAGMLASPFSVNSVYSDNTNTNKLTGLAQVDSQKGQFRTKGLRNIAGAGPYMHDGQFATLAAVVEFYDQGGGAGSSGIVKDPKMVPLGLTAGQKSDLVEFLKTLSGAALSPQLVVDTSK
jgi:cytochrome c peroxidase